MKDRIQRLQKFARLLDSQFEGPFGIKFGLDPLIGLIPGFGDIFTSIVSFFIVVEAYYMGCSPAVLMRMVFNIFLEDFIKVVPILGQLFDFYWKSNLKNMALLEKHLQSPVETRRASIVFFALLGLSFILAMTLSLALVIWTIVGIVRLVQGM
jgi:hypothetical protein